ncbi:unnamed protein product, partial [Nesidiocoris tenuis]
PRPERSFSPSSVRKARNSRESDVAMVTDFPIVGKRAFISLPHPARIWWLASLSSPQTSASQPRP